MPGTKKKNRKEILSPSLDLLCGCACVCVCVGTCLQTHLAVHNSAFAFTSCLCTDWRTARDMTSWPSRGFWSCAPSWARTWPSPFPAICARFHSPYCPKHLTPQRFLLCMSIVWPNWCFLPQMTAVGSLTFKCSWQMPLASAPFLPCESSELGN